MMKVLNFDHHRIDFTPSWMKGDANALFTTPFGFGQSIRLNEAMVWTGQKEVVTAALK